MLPHYLSIYCGSSFALLYSIDELVLSDITIKVIGHQWYWSYEYANYICKSTGKGIRFDSYIIKEGDITLGGLRLLEVDHRVKLPINQHIKVLVTSSDVLHSWAVPSLGIKIDAVPVDESMSLYLLRKGVFYGQCSEICGVNHGFMPIVVESWIKKSMSHGYTKL